MHAFRAALLCALLVLGASPALAAADDHGLLQVLIESASTPAEHHALAEHFRAKAAEARKDAEFHRSMAKTYATSKLVMAEAQKAHCEKLAADDEAQAKEYEALAAAHDAEAKKAAPPKK